MPISRATVHISTACLKQQRGGLFSNKACHGSCLQRRIVFRNMCVCQASTSCALDTEAVLTRIRGSIVLHDELIPLQGKDSLALTVWRLIKQLPPQERVKLLDVLPPKAFRRLWKLSGGLFRCTQGDVAAVLGTWSLAEDFPDQNDTIVRYHCGVVRQRHFGIVHRQQVVFSTREGELFGLVKRRNWLKPWEARTEEYCVDAHPDQVVPGTLEPILLDLSKVDEITQVETREFFRCAGPGVYVGYTMEYPTTGLQGRPRKHMLLVKDVGV